MAKKEKQTDKIPESIPLTKEGLERWARNHNAWQTAYNKLISRQEGQYDNVRDQIEKFLSDEIMLPDGREDFLNWYIKIAEERDYRLNRRIQKKDFIEYEIFERESLKSYKDELLKKIKPTSPLKKEQDLVKLRFTSNDTLIKVSDLLKTYFKNDTALRETLEGGNLDSPLVFRSNQNQFVEVFRRLKYNGLILDSITNIQTWLCQNFCFTFSRGRVFEIRPLNPSTVWDILSKGKGEPAKKSRICIVDWLPYKNHLKLQKDQQSE